MKLRLPNEVRPPRRKKKPSPFARIAGRFGGGHRLPAHVTGEEDWETDVPQIRMSRAFVVMLALHLVAVGGLFAFHLWGREGEEAADAASLTHDAPPVTAGEAPAMEAAVVSTSPSYTPPRVEVVPEPDSLEPSAETPPLPAGARSHVLLAGETRELVSARYNVSLAELDAANPDAAWSSGARVVIPEAHRVIGSVARQDDTASRPTAPMEATPLPPQPGTSVALTPAVDPAPRVEPAPRAEVAADNAPAEPVEGPAEAEGVRHADAGKRTEVTYVQEKSKPAAPVRETVSAKPSPKSTPKVAPKPEPKKAVESTRTVQVKTTPKKAEPTEKEKPKPSTTPARAAGQRSHIVVKGDTIYNIAKRYGMPASEIMRLNGIKDDGRIRIGDGLKIPVRR